MLWLWWMDLNCDMVFCVMWGSPENIVGYLCYVCRFWRLPSQGGSQNRQHIKNINKFVGATSGSRGHHQPRRSAGATWATEQGPQIFRAPKSMWSLRSEYFFFPISSPSWKSMKLVAHGMQKTKLITKSSFTTPRDFILSVSHASFDERVATLWWTV
jgi:hypothetical protein